MRRTPSAVTSDQSSSAVESETSSTFVKRLEFEGIVMKIAFFRNFSFGVKVETGSSEDTDLLVDTGVRADT